MPASLFDLHYLLRPLHLYGTTEKTENPRLLLRMACPQCKTKQDSLSDTCTNCKEPLHPDHPDAAVLQATIEVAAVEEALKQVHNPPQGSPYGPMDAAYSCLRGLSEFEHIPGMTAFIAANRQELAPYKVAILKRTLTANLYFMGLLLFFALVPLLFGWPLLIVGLMGLPVIAWTFILRKAYLDHQKARLELET